MEEERNNIWIWHIIGLFWEGIYTHILTNYVFYKYENAILMFARHNVSETEYPCYQWIGVFIPMGVKFVQEKTYKWNTKSEWDCRWLCYVFEYLMKRQILNFVWLKILKYQTFINIQVHMLIINSNEQCPLLCLHTLRLLCFV